MGKTYIAHCQSGCYQYDRAVCVGHGLRNHPYAQCGYTKLEDGTIQFISYETIVCEISRDGWFYLYGEFSTTTSKQITWFLREYSSDNLSGKPYTACYSFLRDKYRNGLDYNLITDETRPHVDSMIRTVGLRRTSWD